MTEKEEEKGGEKVQYNYPGTFQSWYVKPVHCAAVNTYTHKHTHTCIHKLTEPFLHHKAQQYSDNIPINITTDLYNVKNLNTKEQ